MSLPQNWERLQLSWTAWLFRTCAKTKMSRMNSSLAEKCFVDDYLFDLYLMLCVHKKMSTKYCVQRLRAISLVMLDLKKKTRLSYTPGLQTGPSLRYRTPSQLSSILCYVFSLSAVCVLRVLILWGSLLVIVLEGQGRYSGQERNFWGARAIICDPMTVMGSQLLLYL